MLDDSSPLNNQKLITNHGSNVVLEFEHKAGKLSLKAAHDFPSEAQATVYFRQLGEAENADILKNGGLSGMASPLRSTGNLDQAWQDALPTEPQNLPFYARWFDFGTINQIERQALPEFFQEKPSKTPEVYQRMRNFMVKLYWRNPKAYLTVSACRRALRGDICGVFRVHAFLEHWSLINFCYKPAAMGWTGMVAHKQWYPSFARKDAASSRQRREYLEGFAAAAPQTAGGQAPGLSACRLDSILCPTVLIARLFELAGEARPLCTRCQKPVEARWFVKTADPQMISKGLEMPFIACTACFELENFPIFYSRTDFAPRSVFELDGHGLEEWSVEERVVVLQAMESASEVGPTIAALKEILPGHSESAIIKQLLHTLQGLDRAQYQLQRQIRHNQLTLPAHLEGAFSSKLTEIGGLLDAIGASDLPVLDDTSHLPSDKDRLGYAEAVEGLAAKVELKLRFFEEFEKILQRERQNLRLLM